MIKIKEALLIMLTSGYLFLGSAFGQSPRNVVHPEWSYNKNIYEVNLRQFTEEGTLEAFREHLPRLKELGVGILWFMPIHPIGEENRKGTLGSYYSVKDYFGLDPALGTKEEFKALVEEIHSMGMYVIIDWVANHSAWDIEWVKTHPEYFTTDDEGNFVPPIADWSDVIDLNYESQGLRNVMTEALVYWVEEFNIDGYRCDVAGMVPTDFWDAARAKLDEIKPVFMLAEWDSPEMHINAFDMTYAWDFHHVMNNIAADKENAVDMLSYFVIEGQKYNRDDFRMRFTSNHDENTWNGTVFERLGDGAEAFAVLSGTVPGMLLIYSGQEAGLDKRLEFFEKDPITWKEHKMSGIYTKLNNLKEKERLLWNGDKGGIMIPVKNNSPENVISFKRQSGDDALFVVLNLSGKKQKVSFKELKLNGEYKELFSEKDSVLNEEISFKLKPWEYMVWVPVDGAE